MGLLFNQVEINSPFIDLRETKFGIENKTNFGIDGFLFSEKIMYLKNVFILDDQDEEFIKIRIFRKYPEIKVLDRFSNIKMNYIDIKIQKILRSKLVTQEDKKYSEIKELKEWQDKIADEKLFLLSEMHSYIVLPEKIKITDFPNKNLLKADLEHINSLIKNQTIKEENEIYDYIKYYEQIFYNYQTYPYYFYHAKKESNEKGLQPVIEVIFSNI